MKIKHELLVVFFVTFTIVVVEISLCFNSALLPNLKADMGMSEKLAQFSFGIGLFALGIAGVLYGAISENIGRRPVILSGLSLFVFGTLLVAISPNATFLLISRFIQGFGAGVGWIVGNACLKDVFNKTQYAKVMNTVHAIAGAVPAIAPALGSLLAGYIGWRLTLGGVVIVALFALVMKIYKFPETNFNRSPITLSGITNTYKSLFTNTMYLKYLSVKVLMVMILFTESANISLIFVENLGIKSIHFGLYVMPVALSYAVASYFSGVLVDRISINKLISIGLALILISNVFLIIVNNINLLDALSIQMFKAFTFAGWGMIFGNTTAALISAVPKNAGAASAIMISLEMLFSAAGIYVMSLFYDGTVVPLSIFMAGTSVTCLIIMNFKMTPSAL